MSSFSASILIGLVNNPPPGTLGSTSYSFSVTSSTLPSGFLGLETNGHFTTGMARNKLTGQIVSPVSTGDQITFTFSAINGSTGLAVVQIQLPDAVGIRWTRNQANPDGTLTLVGQVTTANAAAHNHDEYTVGLSQSNSNNTWTIDPDFETDIQDANV